MNLHKSPFRILLLAVLLFPSLLAAQTTDTLLVYDVPTQTFGTILPISYDTTITSGKTNSSQGWNNGFTNLSTTPPTANLFTNTDFSRLARAADLFDLTDYPIRTGVKIFSYSGDTLGNNCSGMLVGENLVLTACHCVWRPWDSSFTGDSLYVAPAYNDGQNTAGLQGSVVEKYYFFQDYYNSLGPNDIALLEPREPIGRATGWIGIGYDNDINAFDNQVFHKLSYPGIVNPFDTTEVYNGDTLYYNYGYIDVLSPQDIGLNGVASGIPGQSGSSFFYTDNVDYYSVGISTWSNLYRHIRFTAKHFYALENIMQNIALSRPTPPELAQEIKLYPNPFSDQATVSFDNPNHTAHHLEIFDLMGRKVDATPETQAGQISLDRKQLAAGLYTFRLMQVDQPVGTGKFMIE